MLRMRTTTRPLSIFEGYYKTQQAGDKIRLSLEKAKEQDDALLEEIRIRAGVFEEYRERIENPALTDEAREQAKVDAETQAQDIQRMQQDRQRFQAQTQRQLQQRQNAHRDLHLDEIKKIIMSLASERDATLVIDISGLTSNSVPTVLYSDSSWDISDAVLEELNRDAPSMETEDSAEETEPSEESSSE